MRSVVTVPEGLRVDQIVDLLAEKTDFSRKQLTRALADPRSLGLPSYAQGNPEGYLFPATYEVPPNATARSVLKAMVSRYKQAVADARPRRQGRGARLLAARRDDGREHHPGGGPALGRLPEDRAGDLQPARQGPGAPARHHDRLHLQDQGQAHDHQRAAPGRLAVQHLPQHGAAADADLRARREGHRGGARRRPTGRGSTSSRPTRATARRASRRRTPTTSRTSRSSAPTAGRTTAEPGDARAARCSGPRSGTRSRRCCTAPPTPSSAWTGPTRRTSSRARTCPRSSTGSTGRGAACR